MTALDRKKSIEPRNVSQADLKVLRDASHAIGGTVIAINFVEQALDTALSYYFELQAATFSLLPMLDFRSKMLVIQRDPLLCDIIDRDTRKRLHKLYDNRNILAHGYVRMATDGDVLASGESFEIQHSRHDSGLVASQIFALHTEAVALLGKVSEIIEEITEFLNPLMALRKEDPDGTAQEFVARLRDYVDELDHLEEAARGPVS